MRPLSILAAATLALTASGAVRAADAGVGSLAARSPFAGEATSAPAPQPPPPGAALGPLPSAPAPGGGSTPDSAVRYPLKPIGSGGLSYEAPQFSAVIAPDGTVRFHDRRAAYSAPKATFTFDLSDEFARGFAHGTLYPYEKANFLAATFKERTAMAAKRYADLKRAAADDLPRRLDAIWADSRYRRRERRRVIFLLWDEMNPSAAEARPASAVIETWIRKRLPRGSPDAYSDDELRALSRERVGERPFQPYLSPLEMRFAAP
jgi:hypothetical protein